MIITETKMNDIEPIFYAVKYGCFEIYKFLYNKLLENYYDVDVLKLGQAILSGKNSKIFKHFFESIGYSLNEYCTKLMVIKDL